MVVPRRDEIIKAQLQCVLSADRAPRDRFARHIRPLLTSTLIYRDGRQLVWVACLLKGLTVDRCVSWLLAPLSTAARVERMRGPR